MLAAIPPPALPGSGSRVESLRLSSQPGNTELPVPLFFISCTQVYSESRACQEHLTLKPSLCPPAPYRCVLLVQNLMQNH